jgi:hypothetical protein
MRAFPAAAAVFSYATMFQTLIIQIPRELMGISTTISFSCEIAG